VAVHILTLLETNGGEPVTSDHVARSVRTNPGVIRRLVSKLHRAGLVTSRLGAGGGTVLARPADQIRLADVYHAVEAKKLFTMHYSAPSPVCPVGKHIQAALSPYLRRAEQALKGELGVVTLADVVRSVGEEALSQHAAARR